MTYVKNKVTSPALVFWRLGLTRQNNGSGTSSKPVGRLEHPPEPEQNTFSPLKNATRKEINMPQQPNSIVLINGLWMTALCWENWVERYTQKGFRVIAKSWPGMDIDINELRHNPARIAKLGIAEIVEQYDKIIREPDSHPTTIATPSGALSTPLP